MPSRPPLHQPPVRGTASAKRTSARDRGYTAKWDAVAAAFKRQNPLCLGCHAVGRITATEVVDHIIPHRGDQALFWDRGNWQPACGRHHNIVKARVEAMFERGAASNDDLRLDSPLAARLTRDLLS